MVCAKLKPAVSGLAQEFPGKVILFCEVPPPSGGETPFVPSFRVTERALEEFPEMVEELDDKGLRYTFTALSKNDTKSMRGRGWEDAFATSDKAEAERRARALGMDVEWLPDGGVRTILGPRKLTRVFPGRRNRRMWFNTVVGMHGKELSSAPLADGSEIPADFVRRCGEIIEEESIPILNIGQARIYDPDTSPRHPTQDLLETRRETSARA